jgi:hypothetical protein
MTLTDVEHAARELIRLSTEPKWSRQGTAAANRHMRTLRASAFSNDEISQLTRRRWSPNAVKKATAGTRVTAPEDERTTMTVLSEILTQNIPLPDLQSATIVLHQIGPQLPDILELLNQLAERKIPVKDFLDDYARMKMEQLTPQSLKQALDYKQDLEKKNFNLAALSQLKEVAEKYGDFAKVMVALDAYGSLESVQRLTESKKKELEDTNRLLEPAIQQLKAHKDLEEASKGLLKSYQDLQKNLTDAITKMPNDLTTALNQVADEFKKKTDEELKKLSKGMSDSASKEVQETTKNLTTLKEQFNKSKQELSDAVQSAVKTAVEDVNSIVTKGSESVTQVDKTYKDTVESFQKQTTTLLQSLNTQLTKMGQSFETDQKKLQETVATATAESTKKIDELSSHAVEVGKKLDQLEATYKQDMPYLELSHLSDKQYFPYITPRLLYTMKVVVRGFVQWLDTAPSSIRNPRILADSGQSFLQNLNAQVPEV